VKRGAELNVLHAADDDLLMPVANKIDRQALGPGRRLAANRQSPAGIRQGSRRAFGGAGRRRARGRAGASPPAGERERKAVLLGNMVAGSTAGAGRSASLAQALAQATGATLGWLVDSANASAPPWRARCPTPAASTRRPWWPSRARPTCCTGIEPYLDTLRSGRHAQALNSGADTRGRADHRSRERPKYADCLLPVAPFTETAGTFVNCAGDVQTFNGVVKPRGEARPGWKVLRVLGNLLGCPASTRTVADEVRARRCRRRPSSRLSERDGRRARRASKRPAPALERLADVPIYFADPLVRRAPSLQRPSDASPRRLRAPVR
jgi:NADH-quinone oxidoreductase subunit G